MGENIFKPTVEKTPEANKNAAIGAKAISTKKSDIPMHEEPKVHVQICRRIGQLC